MSTATLGLASAFMMTTAQLPDWSSQTISCVPGPVADTDHQVWSAGDVGTVVPATSRYSARNGLNAPFVSSVWCTPARYRSTSACGAMPMKMSLPAWADAARSRILATLTDSTVGMPRSRGEVSA